MLRLRNWKKGVALEAEADAEALIYFRFYEWHLFDAVRPGDHTPGIDAWEWELSADRRSGRIRNGWLQLDVRGVEDGAELRLRVTNASGHAWPEIAALVPCLSPEYAEDVLPANAAFFDEAHTRTWFLGAAGLELLRAREMHYDGTLKRRVLERSPAGDGVFERISPKWPHCDRDAAAGLMVRESVDGRLVTGVAWERFLSAQGHNPRRCMHLSVRPGPLAVGESRTIRGKIYLFAGSKEECLRRYRAEFLAGA